MRIVKLLTLVTVVATPLAAQRFEGTVDAVTKGGSQDSKMELFVKGDRIAAKLDMPAGRGPASGKEGRMIIDWPTMTMTILIPMEMGGAKGMKMVTDMRKAAADAGPPPTIKPLGTSEVIAGYKCENMLVSNKKGSTTVCMSDQLGHFGIPSGGPMGAGNFSQVEQFLMAHPGFPLRVTENDGKVSFEVTKVMPGTVPDDIFTIPDGYMDMSAMGGMMGRGRGGPEH